MLTLDSSSSMRRELRADRLVPADLEGPPRAGHALRRRAAGVAGRPGLVRGADLPTRRAGDRRRQPRGRRPVRQQPGPHRARRGRPLLRPAGRPDPHPLRGDRRARRADSPRPGAAHGRLGMEDHAVRAHAHRPGPNRARDRATAAEPWTVRAGQHPPEHRYPIDDFEAARVLVEPGARAARTRLRDLQRRFLFGPATTGRNQKAAVEVAARAAARAGGSEEPRRLGM